MKNIFVMALGAMMLLSAGTLFAQNGSFNTLNVERLNFDDGDVAATFTVFDGRDLRLDVVDDYTIRFPNSTSNSFNVTFNGLPAFRLARENNPSLAIFEPVGTNNNIAHLEAGAYGIINGTSKWLGLGSGPVGVLPSVYGLRTQWNSNFGIFNLADVNATTKDLIIAWGGTTSNNRLRFNYSSAPTVAPSTYMQIESNGNVGIGAVPSTTDKLRVNGRIRFGSVEFFEDGGGFVTTSSGSIVPEVNNARDLGNATFRWDDVFATNGVIQTSDRRDKTNITDMDYGLEEVMDLRPVTYDWKMQPEKGTQVGLIAQEVNEILPNIVYDPAEDMNLNEEGLMVPVEVNEDSRMGINYALMTPVLVKAIQEQQGQIEEQKALIEELQQQLGKVIQDEDGSQELMPKLYQNTPNPFEGTTEIGFYLPASVNRATLYIYDMQGQQVMETAISERGESSYTLNGTQLRAGMYLYALIADGKEVDVKRMILTQSK